MLKRKMFRTLWQYKAQFISMIIMVALGIGVFLGANIEWYSLKRDTDDMFERTGFADYRIYSEKGFTEENLNTVKAIEGVRDATRYLSVNTSVKDDTDVIALTVCENPAVSGFLLTAGEAYDPESPDGLWLSDRYAAANGLTLGDSLTLTYKTISVTGTIRGLIKSSEYLICLPDETQMMPDYTSYGYAYISPVMLENAIPKMFRLFMGSSMYYQINVLSDLEKADFVAAADQALGKTWLVLSRAETVSWSETQGEIEEGQTMGAILPVLFLAIAILTMVTTMHRITASEKTQIGTLKALGFRDRRILLHYSVYALVIGLIGTAIGIGLGYFLGWFILSPGGAMDTYIDLPAWHLHMPEFCIWVVIGVNLFLTLIGFLSVKKMLSGTAADALRPYTPRRMRHLALEETKLFKSLDFGTKWNLRDCLRHKSRSGMTLLGILGCMVLLVGGMGMKDTADAFVNVFFDQANNYQTRVYLDTANVSRSDAEALAEELQGDWVAASNVQVGDRGFSLEIYHVTRDKIRFADAEMNLTALGSEGAYICDRMQKEFGLREGDTLTFTPYGEEKSYSVSIAGVLRSLTEGMIMTDACADRAGIPYTISSIFTDKTDLASNEQILNTQSRQSILDSFGTFMQLMNTMIVMLVVAAVILGIVVLYNLGVMSYLERYREMATLKVLGFKDKKIGRLLISQNLWLTVLGVLLGLPAGYGVLQYLLTALATEYEMKLVIGPATYLLSILLTFGVSFAVGLMVARRNKHIDMVSALKADE